MQHKKKSLYCNGENNGFGSWDSIPPSDKLFYQNFGHWQFTKLTKENPMLKSKLNQCYNSSASFQNRMWTSTPSWWRTNISSRDSKMSWTRRSCGTKQSASTRICWTTTARIQVSLRVFVKEHPTSETKGEGPSCPVLDFWKQQQFSNMNSITKPGILRIRIRGRRL